MKTNGLYWSAPFQINVAIVTAPDQYTVVFKLKKPNSRFHALFTVRWNAMWMMPKHVFEKAGDPLQVRLQPAGLARRLHAAQLRSERQVVHLAEARRLAADHGRPLRRARPEIRHLHRPRPARQAGDRADQPRARHHPRRLARGHVHPRQAVAVVARLVPGLPLCPSRSDAAGGDLQQPERDVPEPRRPLGAGAADRHQGRVDGVLSRRGDHLGDRRCRRPARIPTTITSRSQDWLEELRARHRQAKIKPYDPTVGKQIADMLRPSMGDADPDRSKAIATRVRLGWWKKNPEAAAELLERAGFTNQGDALVHAGRQAVHDQAHGRGRRRAGDDPRRHDDRPAMAPVRHRRHHRGRRRVPSSTRRAAGDFEADHAWSVETWGGHPDLSFFLDSWHSQFVAKPGDGPDAAQLAALVATRARQDHREDPHHRLRRSDAASSSARSSSSWSIREMPTIPLMSYNVFTVMDDTYWTGFPTAERSLHRSGAELGEHQVHVGQAQADEQMAQN